MTRKTDSKTSGDTSLSSEATVLYIHTESAAAWARTVWRTELCN